MRDPERLRKFPFQKNFLGFIEKIIQILEDWIVLGLTVFGIVLLTFE
jgi:hypothetical protein